MKRIEITMDSEEKTLIKRLAADWCAENNFAPSTKRYVVAKADEFLEGIELEPRSKFGRNRRLPKTGRHGKFEVRVEDEWLERVRSYANAQGLSTSLFLRCVLGLSDQHSYL